MTMSHDLVNDKKWSRYKIDARNEKHDEISMTAYFKATDILVRDFTVILLRFIWKTAAGWRAWPSSTQFF